MVGYSASYLDLLVKLEDNEILRELCKPTRERRYLDNSSCRLRHVRGEFHVGKYLEYDEYVVWLIC